jgi:phage terminase large subunit-like protein
MAELPPLGESGCDWYDDESDEDVMKEGNTKRRKLYFVIVKGCNPPVRNIIIPLQQLISSLMNNFLSWDC